MQSSPHAALPHIVVVGAGFGGLTFVRDFPSDLARITVIDRQNYHVFQPLLYQVATAGLAATDIAQPIRGVFGGRANLDVLMSEVTAIDLAQQRVQHSRGELHYDYLIFAVGANTSYFGHDDWEKHAPGLKSLDDALRIRRLILTSFERAETEPDPARREALMNIVVVGGGPTGVELAGAFAELTQKVLAKDFDHIDPRKARILLIQGGDRILPTFDPSLSAKAQEHLANLGVEVRTGKHVEDVKPGAVVVGGTTIPSDNIIWAAGVRPESITRQLGVPLDRHGRIQVLPDVSVPGHPNVFALGDTVYLKDANGVEVPGVAQGAIQMARHAARLIAHDLRHGPRLPADRPAFAYYDKGSLATVGRTAAVAEIKNMKLSGFFAWVVWATVHVAFLIGFRNKSAVLMQWAYSYLTYKRGARIITGTSGEPAA
ncbi:MAG TPA: NAD(P)/FAD-dependent oxidoreductase [Opitutaceae bacterium]|nr:NAD(P)/FAD-dependent oxidoreductase [Opitutaceae bacterium]